MTPKILYSGTTVNQSGPDGFARSRDGLLDIEMPELRAGRRYAVRLAVTAALITMAHEANASTGPAAPSADVAPANQPANAADTTFLAASEKKSVTAVRPFEFRASDGAIAEMRRRIVATQWPEKETVDDLSQGVPLATMQKLARYWTTEYDWRKVEARLNALPHFITEIDGLDIHFIHVRSKHENALPVIVTHGWPGSIIEQLK